jgi:GAF domain-containing protein
MQTLLSLFDRIIFWRDRRQWWNQFWKQHLVHGVAANFFVAGIALSWLVPSTFMSALGWIIFFVIGGQLLYVLRTREDSLPGWFKYLAFDRLAIRAHSQLGVLVTGLFAFALFSNPDYRAAIQHDVLWTFYLLPLVYFSRYGDSNELAWVLLPAGFLTLFVPLAVLGFTPDTFLSAIFGTLFVVMFAMGVHGTLQTLDEKDARVRRLNSIISQISNRHELKTRSEWIVEIIGKELRYPLIHLMTLDPLQNALTVQAAHGRDKKYWRLVSIPQGQGLTSRAYETGQVLVCNDTLGRAGKQIGYVAPEGYADIHSEMAVPLKFGKERLGVLDFQSRRRGEFNEEDIIEARLLARAVSIAIKWNQTTSSQLLLWETINRGQRIKEMKQLIEETLAMANEHLGSAVITFYPLIPETGLPDCAQPYRRGELLCDECNKGGADSFQPGKSVYQLVSEWKFYFSSDAPTDRKLRGEVFHQTDFIQRERIQSVVFAPLGERDYKLGALFINFRDYREFSPAAEYQMRAFSAAFTLAILRIHEHARATESLRAGVHRNLARYLFSIRTQMQSIRESVNRLRDGMLDEQLVRLEESIVQLRGRVLRDTGGIFDLPATGLQDALQNAFGSLQPAQPTTCHIKVSAEVEHLSRSIHAILYNFAVEAMSNALAHGHASRIRADVRLNPGRNAIECQVVDDGGGFDPTAVRPGVDGIFVITEWIERELKGAAEFHRREENGMRVQISIPILTLPGG